MRPIDGLGSKMNSLARIQTFEVSTGNDNVNEALNVAKQERDKS